ncbi:hypothetical protein ACO0LH_13050 [Undibacterium sp. TJN19]
MANCSLAKAMNIPYLKFSVLLFALLGSAGAMADNTRSNAGGFWGRFGGGDAHRKPEAPRKQDLLSKQHERQMNKQPGQNRIDNVDRCNGDRTCNKADDAQKRNRLTPDEKRALRRQIQDAGHDIYTPVR